MPKSLPAAVTTEMNAQQKRPVLLFEIGLSSTLRFAAYKTNIVFPTGGNVYTAKAIQLSGVAQTLEGQINRVTVKFDNVVRDMAAYAYNEDFKGKSLVIKRIYLDAVGNATYYNEVFSGYMEGPSDINRHWFTVSATAGQSLMRKALTFPYQRMCPWVFGGTECNTDGLADLTSLTVSGTADSGATARLIDSILTEPTEYWRHGRISVTKDGVTYNRKIKASSGAIHAVYFDVDLPVAVDNTTTYTLYKGCDQTWDTCSGIDTWGPSADNKANFGGCMHIAKPGETT